jgi:hypothetical protein
MNVPQIFERRIPIALPRLALIAVSRGMLGLGIGLLVASRVPPADRRKVGWTLVLTGLLSTIPLAAGVLHELRD